MEQLTQFLFNTDHSAPGIGELMIFVAIILIVPSLTQALYARRAPSAATSGIDTSSFDSFSSFLLFQFLLRDSRSLRCNGRRLLLFLFIFSPLPAWAPAGRSAPG